MARKALIQTLESLERAGLSHLPKPAATERAVAVAGPAAQDEERPRQTAPGGGQRDLLAVASASPGDTLEIIQNEVAACTRCGELVASRTQTVFGVGNPQARLCFLGEAPGADEDRQGEPFVGLAGQLLDKIIVAMGLAREQVYILNILKCRPPRNRAPALEEARNCRGFLDRQLALIGAEYICCLGAVAAQNLLDTTTSIGKLRGSWHNYAAARVICTYHPAYLLRNPAAKKDTWEDIKLLMQEMGLKIPAANQA